MKGEALLIILASVIMLAIVGAAYQQIGSQKDAASHQSQAVCSRW